ncbi:coiled-coil domain-containing protein [Holzapfeliella sp. JNUCC 72]
MKKDQSKSTKLVAVLACSVALGMAGITTNPDTVHKTNTVLADQVTNLDSAQSSYNEAKANNDTVQANETATELEKELAQKKLKVAETKLNLEKAKQKNEDEKSELARLEEDAERTRAEKQRLGEGKSNEDRKRSPEFQEAKKAHNQNMSNISKYRHSIPERESQIRNLEGNLTVQEEEQNQAEQKVDQEKKQKEEQQIFNLQSSYNEAKANNDTVQANETATELEKELAQKKLKVAETKLNLEKAKQKNEDEKSELARLEEDAERTRAEKQRLGEGKSNEDRKRSPEFQEAKKAHNQNMSNISKYRHSIPERESQIRNLEGNLTVQEEEQNQAEQKVDQEKKQSKNIPATNSTYYPTPTPTKPTIAATKAIKVFEGVGVLEWKFEDGKMKPSTEYLHNNDKTDLTDDIKVVDGVKYVRLANDKNQWIQEQYLHEASEAHEESVSGTLTAGNVPYGIFLRDSEGKMTEQLIQPDTSWRVFGKKTFFGHTYYRLGTDQQWIEDTYVNSIEK